MTKTERRRITKENRVIKKMTEQGCSCKMIGKKLGLSKQAINDRQFKLGIRPPKHGKGLALQRNEEKRKLAEHLYYGEQLNDRQIAERMGVSGGTVGRWRRHNKLPPNRKHITERARNQLKDEVLNLLKRGFNDREISEILGVHRRDVREIRVKEEIPPNYRRRLKRNIDGLIEAMSDFWKLGYNDRMIAQTLKVPQMTVFMWRQRNRCAPNRLSEKTIRKKLKDKFCSKQLSLF